MPYKDPEKKLANAKAYREAGGQIKWRKANPDKVKSYWLKYQYDITLKRHKQMYIDQGGCCGVCGKPIEYEDADTDHNHLTGKVRGLTCHQCNLGLGMFFVDAKGIELLKQAIKYMNERT